ncbi:phosphatidylinositide phosphatase SAC1 [Trichonephila clavipes]|nr:phosphatidylinositide phosphatase SAC1 [Trichonephila clavipes]
MPVVQVSHNMRDYDQYSPKKSSMFSIPKNIVPNDSKTGSDSILGIYTLGAIRLGVLNQGQKVEDHSVFEYIYKNAWADHADIVSIQYAGTGALKTDFTRTGKRGKQGLVKDGINSVIRYFKNNFADGFRQDSIDLFLGNYQVDEGEGATKPCPLEDKKDLKYSALPIILLIAIAMCFLSLIIPSVLNHETLLFVMFWFGMVVATFIVIMYYGPEFVDYPKLQELRPIRMKYE